MPDLKTIAVLLGGELRGNASLEIRGVQALHKAGTTDIAYVAKDREDADLSGVHAGALIVAGGSPLAYANRILVPDPQLAFARLLDYFHPRRPFWTGIADNAFISETAELATDASIGPFSYIGEKAPDIL